MNGLAQQAKLAILVGVSAMMSGCCAWFPSMPWCDTSAETTPFAVTPSSITRLCPTHIGGDREFKGHGPDVTVTAEIERRNGNQEIWAVLYLNAKETRSDWTEAEGNWDRRVWSVPTGQKVNSIDTDLESNAGYVDTDHDLDRPSVRGGTLVSRFEVMGDTGGNDVGNCTADDVYLNVYFNEIRGTTVPQ